MTTLLSSVSQFSLLTLIQYKSGICQTLFEFELEGSGDFET